MRARAPSKIGAVHDDPVPGLRSADGSRSPPEPCRGNFEGREPLRRYGEDELLLALRRREEGERRQGEAVRDHEGARVEELFGRARQVQRDAVEPRELVEGCDETVARVHRRRGDAPERDAVRDPAWGRQRRLRQQRSAGEERGSGNRGAETERTCREKEVAGRDPDAAELGAARNRSGRRAADREVVALVRVAAEDEGSRGGGGLGDAPRDGLLDGVGVDRGSVTERRRPRGSAPTAARSESAAAAARRPAVRGSR